MYPSITLKRAMAALVVSPVVFMVLSVFLSTSQLKNIFTPLAFGVALMIWGTWLISLFKNSSSRAWKLIFGVFATYLTIFGRSIYVYLYSLYGRPDTWADSPISAYWSYGFAVAGLAILAATIDGENEPATIRKYWVIAFAVAVGAFAAGYLFATGFTLME